MIAPPDDIRRLVYLGTPALAVPPLRALHRAGFEIPLVVSRADKRRGRRGTPTPSPVKAAAQELGIPVTTSVDDVLAVDADLGVVVAYGRLIRPHVLEHLAMVNLHFSLLPRWRGAAPVERAILAGDQVTGVCLMDVAEELDSGDIYRVQEVAIRPGQTAAELRAELLDAGVSMLVEALDDGLGSPVPQRGEVVYASKIEPSELELDWNQPAEYLDRVIRLGNAWTVHGDRRLKVWDARVLTRDDLEPGEVDGAVVGAGQGAVELVEVQPEGKPRRDAADWARGARLDAGDRLGS